MFASYRRVFALAVATAATIALSTAAIAQEEPKQAMPELKVGDKAPEWTLKASDGKTYSLVDFKDKQPVVLAFFPKAFTPGCTAQCKDLSANEDKLDESGAAYFMISIDNVEDQTRFAGEHDAEFPILADPDKEVAKQYGVLHERGFAQRWTFYIDDDGVIQKIDKQVKPATAATDTLKTLIELGMADDTQ